MDSDGDNGRDWDVDNIDGKDEIDAMEFLFEHATTDDLQVGFDQAQSPGKTKYWVPTCVESVKPSLGKRFPTVEAGKQFYKKYGALVGFDVKMAGSRDADDGTVLHRYLRCNRSGFARSKNLQGKRKRLSNRVGCRAHIYLKFKGLDGYDITGMEDRHNHELMQQGSNQFLKSHRKLDFGHQRFMVNCARANLGPAMAHRLMKEARQGASHGGPMIQDLKNFKRDVMAYISGADAQMVIDRFLLKKQSSSAFFFDHAVNEKNQLVMLFWCDPIARANYAAFGDVVSFDSTYRSNKYSMVFAPFTGMDNNRKSVTFGAGLLLHEDKPSYKWLFERFQTAMGKDPPVIVTDQDPSMREVIPVVFPNTRHRFCMWHIMMKVPKEVPREVCSIKEFRQHINKCVWSYEITVAEFEEMWNAMILEFTLEKNSWLALMYKVRANWIPAYFRDVPMGGLIRTTSISESANSFFGGYSSRHFSLVELMMHFDGAMDAQRHAQAKLDMETTTLVPKFETRLRIEKHAASVYTLTVFSKVQKEISDSVTYCNVINEVADGQGKTHVVEEEYVGTFQVSYDLVSQISTCKCNTFNQVGIPCEHIFATYKYMGFKKIPDAMVKARWTKQARALANAFLDDEVLKQSAEMEARKALVNRIWGSIYSTVGLVEDDMDLIKDFMKLMVDRKPYYMEKAAESSATVPDKTGFVEKYVGVKPPKEVTIEPPPQAKNKGHRLKGSLEKAIEKTSKSTLRKCGRCGNMAYHDKRNCKVKLSGKGKEKVGEVEEVEEEEEEFMEASTDEDSDDGSQ